MNKPSRLPLIWLALGLPLTCPAQQEPVAVRPTTIETGHALLAERDYRGAFQVYSGVLWIIPYGSLRLYWERGQTEEYRKQSEEVGKIVRGMATCLSKLDPPPAIPESADFHAQKGAAFVKHAKDQRDFEAAIKEFQSAINSAAWVSDYHFNLALCQKSAKQLEPALVSLRFAALLATEDKQRRDIGAMRAEIEALQEINKRR